MIEQLEPKSGVLARKDTIVAGLRKLLSADAVISEPLRLKPYETDGLPAFRQVPLAVALPSTTEQGCGCPGLLASRRGARCSARRGHEPVGRSPADGR